VATKRKRIIRPTYVQHDEAIIIATIKAAIPQGGVFADYLCEVGLEPVDGASEFERGVNEGRRRLAGDLLAKSLSEQGAE